VCAAASPLRSSSPYSSRSIHFPIWATPRCSSCRAATRRRPIPRRIPAREFLQLRSTPGPLDPALERDVHLPAGAGLPGASQRHLFARLDAGLLRLDHLRLARPAIPARPNDGARQQARIDLRAAHFHLRHGQGHRGVRHPPRAQGFRGERGRLSLPDAGRSRSAGTHIQYQALARDLDATSPAPAFSSRMRSSS
jgi:hypothetical protein